VRAHHRHELTDGDLPVAVEVTRLHDDVDEPIGLVVRQLEIVLGEHDVHEAVELGACDATVAVDVVQVEEELELFARARRHEPLRDGNELLGRLEATVAPAERDEQAIREEEAAQPEGALHGDGVDSSADAPPRQRLEGGRQRQKRCGDVLARRCLRAHGLTRPTQRTPARAETSRRLAPGSGDGRALCQGPPRPLK